MGVGLTDDDDDDEVTQVDVVVIVVGIIFGPNLSLIDDDETVATTLGGVGAG